MVGACAMAKRLAKYTKLADYRLLNGKSDTFVVDILIGNDNRGKFLSKTIRPKQVLCMWLDSTVWGDSILSGPIPGSEGLLDEHQSANIVTVCNIVDMPLLNDDEVVDKEHMIEVAKHLNSLENLGISLTDKQEQDERSSQIISQMPVPPLIGRSVPPLLGRSELPLLGRLVPPLLGNGGTNGN